MSKKIIYKYIGLSWIKNKINTMVRGLNHDIDHYEMINGVNVFIGKHTYGTQHITLLVWSNPKDILVTIGRFCSIAHNLKIFSGGNHRTEWITTYPFGHTKSSRKVMQVEPVVGHPAPVKPIIIGHDVWIGRDVTIMSGVTIGNGAVIAANSHVVNDVPAYAVVWGNPAKIVEMRFSKEKIEYLNKLCWWNWSDEKIKNSIEFLCAPFK
jgi:acetyltransferase-like isoleucine patch superfamily enzyme